MKVAPITDVNVLIENEEQAKQVMDIVFNLGGSWASGCKDYEPPGINLKEVNVLAITQETELSITCGRILKCYPALMDASLYLFLKGVKPID